MSFYTQFAELYEAVFPYRDPVRAFLAARIPPRPAAAGPGAGSEPAAGAGGASGGPARARLLDLGCGPGHYAGRLAEAGHDAVGIDLDAGMIATAARRYPAASFRRLDLRQVDRLPGPFDLAFCIGNTAAHLPLEEYSAFLARLARVLRPGARWIVQLVNWDFIVGRGDYRFPDRPVTDPAAAGLAAAAPRFVFRREYREVTPRSVRFLTRLDEVGEAGPRAVWEGDTTLYPLLAADGLRRHGDAGFVLEEHLGDYDGRPFAPDREGANITVCRFAG
jgi:SAM-dependent methyltransferase